MKLKHYNLNFFYMKILLDTEEYMQILATWKLYLEILRIFF